MTIGTQLRRAQIEQKYDTIVIGSGIGGLTTAVCLAKAGQKVLVLERHYTAGGFTHTYARKGYEWDVGVHYIGEVHRKESSLRRIFDYLSDEQLQWSEMGAVYDRIYLGKQAFDYVKGEDNFCRRMTEYFPSEEQAIRQYVELIKKASRSAGSYYLEHSLPPLLAKIFYKKLTRKFFEYADRTTEEVLLSLTNNRQLIAVLTGQWGDYGLPPRQSSFMMHAQVARHYLDGGNYPQGGSISIARTIAQVLHQRGGQLITSADVTSIVLKGNRAVGVSLADGRTIQANNVVSSAGVINTFQQLLPDSCALKQQFLEQLQEVSPSIAHVGLYIGLKGTAQELNLQSTNLWIYADEKHDENIAKFLQKPNLDFPVVYVSFPSTKDPQWEKNYPGKSTIEIVAPAPYAWFKQWQGTRWQKRGEDYVQFKKDISERLLAILLEKMPQLKDKIHYHELSTPLSTAHFSNYQHGEIYGLNHDPQRFRQRWLRTDTPVKRLYLTGQDIVSCGIGGALSAGVMTAIRMLGPFRARPLIQLLQPVKRQTP